MPPTSATGSAAALFNSLIFPPGVRENQIGGSATSIPIEPGSISKLTLHCSFEHFEGNADSEFLTEAARILRPGGVLCILPFYISHTHVILTDPLFWNSEAALDPGASWYFHPFGNRFGRVYSPPVMSQRLLPPLRAFDWEIVWFKNRAELFPGLWCDFALVATKARATTNLTERLTT